MRAFDRDLIRGGHYGQRPRVPHSKAEHMAAPTKAAANVKKVLANSEPSTHGTSRHCAAPQNSVAFGAYPILPSITHVGSEQARQEIYHIRDCSLYTPRDFDISPYFAVVSCLMVAIGQRASF
jgi:hypothetical protein